MRIGEFKLGAMVRRKIAPVNPKVYNQEVNYPQGRARSITKRGTKYYVLVEFPSRSEEIALDRLEYVDV